MEDASGLALSNPLAGLFAGGAALDARTIASVMLVLMFAFWAAYTTIAAYHLIRYGHRSWLTVPALALHLFVSFTIATFAIGGLI
jgi:hypothetical protein